MPTAEKLTSKVGRDGDPSLTAQDRKILDSAENFLANGLQLKQWFETTAARDTWKQKFTLGRTFNSPRTGFGFFDQVQLPRGPMPVMGNFQEMFYDRIKAPAALVSREARSFRDQLREFVLHYFMRVSAFEQPQALIGSNHAPKDLPLRLLSWCPDDDVQERGFGFQQLYFKERGTGRVGKFAEDDRLVVDLREIGASYDWILLKLMVFDFTLKFQPLGSKYPQLDIPLRETSYLIVSRDFLCLEEDPAPGILGRYGLGYAFIKNPGNGSNFAYGPGEFDAATQLIRFEVSDKGEAVVRMTFVANRPTRILNVTVDPIGLAFRLANIGSLGLLSRLLPTAGVDHVPRSNVGADPVLTYIDFVNRMTGGAAKEMFCTSKEQLEKEFLAQHFMQHYTTIAATSRVWREVGDWYDPPKWVQEGQSP